MTSWADIQKLASDLQRVQLSHSSKKLSEVNCIEVLQKLIASQQIDVVYTRDGHSYVTKKHLETEVFIGFLHKKKSVKIKNVSKRNDGQMYVQEIH
ncbi:hypothetical protein GCK72_011969 [Caenorhabditis remanei]|uniref:E3 UFM1-protein ligase 1 homolog n=1 Tax=Caenorhabditis remanei TaxID=31234 RepID=A0A6A5GMH2_CAERE|nr:hypothetical protein GCK72_011969 [Caenorhabditis remanei]KAF1755519.1 hypothetical protein GCK72_011969 [Caenorhabditis remanei]